MAFKADMEARVLGPTYASLRDPRDTCAAPAKDITSKAPAALAAPATLAAMPAGAAVHRSVSAPPACLLGPTLGAGGLQMPASCAPPLPAAGAAAPADEEAEEAEEEDDEFVNDWCVRCSSLVPVGVP